jgi:hypothetical protein
MTMRKAIILIAISLIAVTAFAQEVPEMMRKLDFIEGDWTVISTFPATGLEVPGELSYHFVLGGHWMLCRFVGDHPERDVFEAVEMIRWDSEGAQFIVEAFYGAEGPERYTGKLINGTTVRMETTANGRRSGLDYIPTESGVYQENWIYNEKDEKIITLKTVYTRVKN